MEFIDVETLNPKNYIIIKGARVHNLKNVDVAIPRNKLVVITGVSGSGKSSLAFDTLYAEGQRRYVESISAYIRQFVGKIEKPDVDYIRGISPAIAIEQKTVSKNPRSTVGTTTEIYDFMKLLYARIGKTYSPLSGEIVQRHSVTDVVDFVMSLPDDTAVMIVSILKTPKVRQASDQLRILLQQGFSRLLVDNEVVSIEDLLEKDDKKAIPKIINLLVDRLRVDKTDEDLNARIADSVESAFFEGDGECTILYKDSEGEYLSQVFSNKFESDGIVFEQPTVQFFSFNNPYGACKRCEGFGSIIGIDEDLVIPDRSKSIYEEAVACWKGDSMKEWKDEVVRNAHKFDFPIHKPLRDFTEAQLEMLWTGNKYFKGLTRFFTFLEENNFKIQYRVMISRYRGKTVCPECKGSRIRKDASYVKIDGKSITELLMLPVINLISFFDEIKLSAFDINVSQRLMKEIKSRLQFLDDVGLGYLTLNRLSYTLSGGESQRIHLSSSLGSSLVGSLYILDEPSIGLHPRDTTRLINILKSLKKLGNTVVVVEHDEEIMLAADQLIDIGPEAGVNGGNVIFQGSHADLLNETKSLTARYLTGKEEIPIPALRRKWKNSIHIYGIRENNLKNIDVKFPLDVMTVVTGVSGSGKSSLVCTVLYQVLRRHFGNQTESSTKFDKIEGDMNRVKSLEFIDQNPIGKSSRSNPVTYIKAYDDIRNLYASQPLATSRGYKPHHFSFNVDGGRCDNCEGEGEVTIEMQFMADIHLTCEQCNGKRFKEDVLEVKFNEKSIFDILQMTVDEGYSFFQKFDEKVAGKLKPLLDVGLGYVCLGQSSSTLSGGEAQRIKLASFLAKGSAQGRTLFIFDEPTTGLHFHDIRKLLKAFEALMNDGHTLIIIEHNADVIKCADWIIDLGPEGGDKGGTIVFEGTPEDLILCEASYTGKYLEPKMKVLG